MSSKEVRLLIIHAENDCSHLRTSWLDFYGPNGEVISAAASKYLRQDPTFAAAMRNVPSFGAFIKLFDSLELVTSDASGGASKVRLTEEAPPRRRRARTKRPDPNI